MAANYTAITMVPDTTQTLQRLAGFGFRCTAAAVVNIRDRVVGGQILLPLSFATNESGVMFFPKSILTEGSVYVEVVSGTISGVLYEG